MSKMTKLRTSYAGSGRGGRKNTRVSMPFGVNERIMVTSHAVSRYKERLGKPGVTNEWVEDRIRKEVCHSKIIALKPNGEEHRSCEGIIFVCRREMNSLKVVTILMSDYRQKERFMGKMSEFVSYGERETV